MRCELDRELDGQGVDPALARRVRRRVRHSPRREHRRDVDDRAAAGRAHQPGRLDRAEERSLQVRVDHAVPGLLARIDGIDPAGDAGAVDEHVEPLEARERRPDLRPTSETSQRSGEPAPGSGKLGERRSPGSSRSSEVDDRALGGEADRERATDPAAGAGDQRDLALRAGRSFDHRASRRRRRRCARTCARTPRRHARLGRRPVAAPPGELVVVDVERRACGRRRRS